MKYFIIPVTAMLAFTSLPSAQTFAKPSGVPVHPSARCAAFWSGMTRLAPQESAQYKEMTARKDAWQAHAATAIGAEKAKQIVNNDGPALGNQIRELANDPDALQAFSADYADCETVPASGSAIATNSASAPKPSAPPAPAVTEKDRANGEMALRCTAMARLYEADDNFLLVNDYGKSSVYLALVRHFRPDLSSDDIEKGLVPGTEEFTRLWVLNVKKYRAAGINGQKVDLTETEYFVEARKCAQMANVMSRFVKN